MKLICYLEENQTLDIQPAPLARDWMNQTPDRFAYRCLPLSIANTHGWVILSPHTFEATWNGTPSKDAIAIHPANDRVAISHFGSGVLTVHVPAVFRTEPGWNLIVMGPPNNPKAGIQPLMGVVETDWAPSTFTMNWLFTDVNRPVKFTEGEPYCFIFPTPRGIVDSVEPEFRDIKSDPYLHEQNKEWAASRKYFNDHLSDPESDASKQKWQKTYFSGQRPDGTVGTPDHQMKNKPKQFTWHK